MQPSGEYRCNYCDTLAVVRELTDSLDGLRLTGHSAGLPCPRCPTETLMDGSIDAVALAGCQRCQGIWLPMRRFALLRDRRRAVPPRERSLGERRVEEQSNQLRRVSQCPKCDRQMKTYFYAGPGRVVLDGCSTCSMVWMDCGELTSIATAAGVS